MKEKTNRKSELNMEKKPIKKIRRIKYNATNICDNIKEDGNRCENRLYPGNAYKSHKGGKSIWLCKSCYNKERYLRLANHYHDAEKSIADSRTGNLDRLDRFGKMVIGQWITGKTLGIKDLSIEKDHFSEPIDHSRHSIYGDIDTKISSYDNIEKRWTVSRITHNFDNICIICMDGQKPWISVKRVYIILEEKINGSTITIVENPSKGGWYEEYRIDEKPFNDVYQSVDIPRYFSPFDLWKGKYDKTMI